MSPAHTLLLTKLSRPQLRPTLVARPRLRQLLHAADARPLTLICAPAGYGKTTVILDWLADCQTAAWLSLDESDNDPVRFWTYVIAALQTVAPGVGEQALTLLQSPQPSPWSLTRTFLLNDLSALVQPHYLILDDYHAITHQGIHESLAVLLERLPPAMHLILTSRADPPLPLGRLRVRGQLAEIRERDLRFTPEETAEFMQQVMGLSLTTVQLQSLAARTEGWVAGLQLAGLAVAGTPHTAEMLHAFSGSQRHLVDYLTEEVLARQPAAVQTFLRQTAMFDRFCAPLCQAALDDGDWRIEMEGHPPITTFQALLEYLDRANLFLIPLDSERRWYRYHHLFADLLRFRAMQTLDKATQRQIHQRAAVWFAHNQLEIEAIAHALAAGDKELAAGIIAQQAAAAVTRGELASLKEWLAALSPAQIEADSRLCLAQAWVDLFEGRLEAAEAWLHPALAHAPDGGIGDEALWGQALAVRATLAFARQDAAQTIADTQQALALLPAAAGGAASALPLRALLSWHLAFTYRSLGQTQPALAWYHQTIELSRQGGNFLINLSARRELGSFLIGLGDLSLAQTVLNQLLAEAEAKGWAHVPAFSGAHVHLGEIFYEWNALDSAIAHLQTALALPQAQEMGFDAYAYALLARAYAGKGDQTAAIATVHQAMQRAPAAIHPQRRLLALAQITRFWLAQGDLTRATAWLPDGRDVPADPRQEVFARQQITQAYYLLATGEKAAAAELVGTLLPAVTAAGRLRQIVELWLLHAQLRAGEEANAALRQALALAEPAGLLRTLIDAGPSVAALLTRLHNLAGVSHPYLQRLAATVSLVSEPPANRLLLEPLSERELEVLRLMAEGYSNREIAGKLFFTVATAKKHAEHIYGKLGANSRTQALARARELGLLT